MLLFDRAPVSVCSFQCFDTTWVVNTMTGLCINNTFYLTCLEFNARLVDARICLFFG